MRFNTSKSLFTSIVVAIVTSSFYSSLSSFSTIFYAFLSMKFMFENIPNRYVFENGIKQNKRWVRCEWTEEKVKKSRAMKVFFRYCLLSINRAGSWLNNKFNSMSPLQSLFSNQTMQVYMTPFFPHKDTVPSANW